MRLRPWTEEEKAFLRENIKGTPFKTLTERFNAKFNASFQAEALKKRCYTLGLGKTGHLGGPPSLRDWTEEEHLFLRNNVKGTPYATLAEMFNTKFNACLTPKQIQHLCSRRGYGGNGLCVQVPIGTEYVRKRGIQVKVAHPKVRRFKHHLVWEDAFGPIPKGCVILFADRNNTNCALDNLLLATSAEASCMGVLNLFSDDPELTKAGLNTARLICSLRTAKKRHSGKARKSA
ncbi:HNH endonuclease [Desulfovibrio sp. OttesenSCG-928-G15]|nr:HNH endonuclease [Desulfovibrio sp. OttesenSCG-928-G15]